MPLVPHALGAFCGVKMPSFSKMRKVAGLMHRVQPPWLDTEWTLRVNSFQQQIRGGTESLAGVPKCIKTLEQSLWGGCQDTSQQPHKSQSAQNSQRRPKLSVCA